jgi:DNA recombination protein RmuC
MNSMEIAVVLISLVFAAGLTWALVRTHWSLKYQSLQAKCSLAEQKLFEQAQFISNTEKAMRDTFGMLATDALNKNNQLFVSLAETRLAQKVTEAKGILEAKEKGIEGVVTPLKESLKQMDEKLNQLENKRVGAYEAIKTVLDGMQNSAKALDKGTQTLVNALKTSSTRGRYGEIGLRRIVEFAGMTKYCDFEEQGAVYAEDRLLKPDMIVRLPEEKTIVVDAKTPLEAYLKAFETEDETEQQSYLAQHAQAVKQHLSKLGAKQYWSQFKGSPDYVVMYMQIESSFGAALQSDPSLIQFGIENKVILATPTTLITLLRTIAFVWQQRNIADNIEEVRKAGIELYNRTSTLISHFSNVGGGLQAVVNNYNKAIGSLETRFLPQARKLYTLGPTYTNGPIADLQPIDTSVRDINVGDRPPENEQ